MKYFGTDGIRGKSEKVLALSYALGVVVGRNNPFVVVGRDTRPSSIDIEKELTRGLLSAGAKVGLAGVLPTPALAHTAKVKGAKAIMITASHNPPEYNGLKVMGAEKLDEEEEVALDKALDDEIKNPSYPSGSGCVEILSGAGREYKRHIIATFQHLDLTALNKKVYIDTAHGCFSYLAKDVLETLGADVVALNNDIDGTKVNVGCGAVHIENFARKIPRDSIGFAFDGDGDRVLSVLDGEVYDGDQMLYNIALHYKASGKDIGGVVGTIMTGSGIEREFQLKNIPFHRADVGDKHVFDLMKRQNCLLGGEKSGHLILLDRASTGDGLVSLLAFLEVFMAKTVKKAKEYKTENFGLEVENPRLFYMSQNFQEKLAKTTLKIGEKGRLIVRPSGTENLVRISVEEYLEGVDYAKIIKENLF